MKIKPIVTLSLLTLGLCVSGAYAATVSGGELTLNINRDALIAGVLKDTYPDTATADFPICCRPSLYLEEFFDSSAASKTFVQLRDDNPPDLYDSVADEIPAIGLQFSVNASSIAANPNGRYNQASTLAFNAADLTSATGHIGFGGVMRFRVDVAPPSNRVLLGDMDLEYDPNLVDPSSGRSGWVLMNNIGFTISGFHLFDVVTDLSGNHLSLSGNLGLGEGFEHLGGITDTRVGTFSIQTAVVPLPGAVWMFVTGLFGLVAAGFRKRRT